MSHQAWLDQAESDLRAAKHLSQAGFHAQAVWLAAQAVEKGHKAILVALGLGYEERHFKSLGHDTLEIFKLLPEALREPADPEIAALIAALARRAEMARYPGKNPATKGAPIAAPAKWMKDSAADVASAEARLDWCKVRIERAQKAVDAMRGA